jgi:hypothetical protein
MDYPQPLVTISFLEYHDLLDAKSKNAPRPPEDVVISAVAKFFKMVAERIEKNPVDMGSPHRLAQYFRTIDEKVIKEFYQDQIKTEK